MPIIHDHPHVDWCDPRMCLKHTHGDGSMSFLHRDAGTALSASPGQTVTLHRTQTQDCGSHPSVGGERVTLTVRDATSSARPGGPPLVADVDLDALDLRALAERMNRLADELDTATLRGTHAGAVA